jgi:N-acyl-phosphatidylethanolamine-hydrolysing phospholipase D
MGDTSERKAGGSVSAVPAAGPAHHRPGGGFRNPWFTNRSARFGGFLRWVLVERPFKKLPRDPDPSVFPRKTPSFENPRARPGELTVTWVGHSTVLLQIGAVNVLTDPMWSERASPLAWTGPKRWVPPGVEFEDLPPIDLVVQSHNHYDHLDARTVEMIAQSHPAASWLVPLGLAGFVRARGAARVEELDWWGETEAAGLRVACVPAQHFSGRGLGDRNATLWCGWTLADDRRRVLFAGDTGHHPEFSAIGQRLGPFDVALMPVGAYEPSWFMRPAHLNPEEAIQAFAEVNGGGVGVAEGRRVMVPIHFGTFKLTDEAMDEPPAWTRRAWGEAGRRERDLWLLAHGETRSFSES